MLDMELKAACHVKDPSIEENWKELAFVLQLSAQAQSDFLTKAQSTSRNLKVAAETSAFNVFRAELENDQIQHRARVALQTAEIAKRKCTLVNTLESFHHTAWRMVQELCDTTCPTWSILTRDLGSQLPGKLRPFLEQALLFPHSFVCFDSHSVKS
jgi:hypothetical protein